MIFWKKKKEIYLVNIGWLNHNATFSVLKPINLPSNFVLTYMHYLTESTLIAENLKRYHYVKNYVQLLILSLPCQKKISALNDWWQNVNFIELWNNNCRIIDSFISLKVWNKQCNNAELKLSNINSARWVWGLCVCVSPVSFIC